MEPGFPNLLRQSITRMPVNTRPAAWTNHFDASLAQLQSAPYSPKPYTLTNLHGRELIVPSAFDRVVQGALQLALQPIYNADIPPHRHGHQGLHAALQATTDFLAAANECNFFRSDIKGFFPNIDRKEALARISKFMDGRIGAWEAQAILASVNANPTPTGLPSGSPLSPLLADICLLPLDHSVEKCFYLRYMDDLLVMGEPMEVANQVTIISSQLQKLGLALSPKKTTAGRWPASGFSLLGQTFGKFLSPFPEKADFLVKGGPEAMGMAPLPGPTPMRGISITTNQSRWSDDKLNIRIWSLNHLLLSLEDKAHPEMMEILISTSILKAHPIGDRLHAIRDSFLHAGMPKALHDYAFKTYVGTIKKAHASGQSIPLDKASLVIRSLQISLAIMQHGRFPESWGSEIAQHESAMTSLKEGDYQGYRAVVSSLFKAEYPLREQQKHSLPKDMPYRLAVERGDDPLLGYLDAPSV